MGKLSKYIFKEFLDSFFAVFSVLVSITSLIFIITISNITSSFTITFKELMSFYFLSLPEIFFITISISFFVASTKTYAKLSETQEIIALFSIGMSPLKILNPILKTAIFFTIINLIFVFVSVPYSKIQFNNLKNEKKQTAKFNFKSAQVSQKFDDWYLFSSNQIFLYSSKKNMLIIAKKANLDTTSHIKLTLKDGKLYDLKFKRIIDFNTLTFNKTAPKIKISTFKDYWQKSKKLFIKYLPIALIPLSLLFFIPITSFFHPRIDKNHSVIYSIILIFVYMGISLSNKSLVISLLIPILFFSIGLILFKRRFS